MSLKIRFLVFILIFFLLFVYSYDNSSGEAFNPKSSDIKIRAISPNKKFAAYIYPFEWEEIGEVFIEDLETHSYETAIGIKDLPPQYTPKAVCWLDDQYLLLIIGYAYGTVSVGGDLYILDCLTNKTCLLIKSEERKEIRNIRLKEGNVILGICKFNDDYTEYTTEYMLLNKDALLKAAKRN